MTDKIILGIDPGTVQMGYGIIHIQGSQINLLDLGTLNMKSIRDHYASLQRIFEFTLALIDKYHPDEIAIEAPFFGKNVQSMLKLGRAQGVAISAGLHRSLPIFEYAPRKIKMAITGNGAASKEQVAGFLKGLLNMKSIPKQLDATDGLAAAVCHHYQKKVSAEGKSFNSWKDFINKNPDRLK